MPGQVCWDDRFGGFVDLCMSHVEHCHPRGYCRISARCVRGQYVGCVEADKCVSVLINRLTGLIRRGDSLAAVSEVPVVHAA